MNAPATATETGRTSVEILGERYTIRGEAEPGYIAEVGRMVDERMRELQAGAPHLSRSRLAVLAAINIADELLQERMSHEEEDDSVAEMARRANQLITLLDEGLIGDSPL